MDLLITFWKANRAGYTWIKSEFGVYTEEEADFIVGNGAGGGVVTSKKVEASVVCGMAVSILYEGKIRKAVPMNEFNLQELGVTPDQFHQKYLSNFNGVEFILDNDTLTPSK